MPAFRLILYVATGLVLGLGGCRSSAIAPTFSGAGGYRLQLVQHIDTATTRTALVHRPALRKRVNKELQPGSAEPRVRASKGKTELAGQPGSRNVKITTGDTTRHALQPIALRGTRQSVSPRLFSAQTLVHYSLHFLFPAVLALVFFPLMWQTAYLLMLATMLMDLDHLLAKPIFDPLRCSVGYHPLHSFYAIPVYVLLLLLPATQIVAVGLLFHLLTDTVDCLWNFSHCHECYLNSRIYALRNRVRQLLGRDKVE
jgi:hypothetical protein